MCEVLEVSASGYFEHWRRKDATKPSKPGVVGADKQQDRKSA